MSIPLRLLIPEDKQELEELQVKINDWKQLDVFNIIKRSKTKKICEICENNVNNNMHLHMFTHYPIQITIKQ